MITQELQNLVMEYIKGEVVNADLGLGGNSTNPINNTLDVPLGLALTGASIVKSDSDENVLEVKVSVNSSTISGKVIREIALFDNTSPTKKMLQRLNFEGVGPFASNEVIEFFIHIEVE